MKNYLLGYDIGSSSVKASVLEIESGKCIAKAFSPEKEMPISTPKPGWAEQDPEIWWSHVKKATEIIKRQCKNALDEIAAVGISYQMHGLVMTDKNGSVLYPSIIWCDSRAVDTGNRALKELGKDFCLKNYLNSPGNFTASKVKWVKDNLPQIFGRINKIMLPGDYIAYRFTGKIKTTVPGLSEGILWNFKNSSIAEKLLNYYGIPVNFLPETVDTFSIQGEITGKASKELGLKSGIPVSYRAGDQPNNAYSLNVLEPGEIAATAGTSGVVYGVGDKTEYDKESRINTFVHINHSVEKPRYGTLLCVNGTGILNSWLKTNIMGNDKNYDYMNKLAKDIPAGSNGLLVYPFGNGAERSLGNRNVNCSFHGINFNIHGKAHLLRAAQEGIVFALNYGLEIMQKSGLKISRIRAGHANMFLSPVFCETFAGLTGSVIELYNTDGSEGAARGAGIGSGIYKNSSEAFKGLKIVKETEPGFHDMYLSLYEDWKLKLNTRAL